jgi:enediyne biosynthesis protein E4
MNWPSWSVQGTDWNLHLRLTWNRLRKGLSDLSLPRTEEKNVRDHVYQIGRRTLIMTAWLSLAWTGCAEEPSSSQGDTLKGTQSDSLSVDAPESDASSPDGASIDAAQKNLCAPRPVEAPAANFFTDISEQSGIRLNNHYPGQSQPINDHSRLGFADINGDGLDDIVMHSLFPNPQAGIPFEHLVFLNNGDGTFKDFADESGLRDVQAGFFAFGDLDNDGDQDCFAGLDVPLPGHTHQVYLNDGAGHFEKVPYAGVENVTPYVANAVFADFNGDATLDVFLGLGQTSAAVPDTLLFGQGDGTFAQANMGQFSDLNARPTNGAVTCDYDNDGDMDIFVSTYSVSTLFGHNHLWENDGGTFTNVAVERGFAAQAGGNTWLGLLDSPEPGKTATSYVGSNGFGLACADISGDGYLDVLLATISHPVDIDYNRKWSDPSQILINRGEAENFSFVNEASLRQLPFNEGDIDAAIIDFDNDGYLDLSLSRENKYEKNYPDDAQKGWFGLMRQNANGTFADMGTVSGINDLTAALNASLLDCTSNDQCPEGEECLKTANANAKLKCRTPCAKNEDCGTPTEVCHAAGFCRLLWTAKRAQNHAWADIEGDGDLDLLIGGRDMGGGRPNFLFRNDIGDKNRWVGIRVVGDGQKVNRDGVGTRVTFTYPDRILTREVHLSRGTYNSMDTKTLLFGLGALECDFEVSVRWPDGTTATFSGDSIQEGHTMVLSYPDDLSVQ